MFDTKIAIVVRDDLATWQKLNVTAFLTSGVIAENPDLVGAPYEDASGKTYGRLSIQPIVVLAADGAGLRRIYDRAAGRGVPLSIYIEDMFETGHDAANRATVNQYRSDDLPLVGLALRAERKLVDKVTKGAKLHP